MTIYNPELRYYVYAYLRKSNLTPFYIGKGCADRMYQKHTIKVPTDRARIVVVEKNLTNIGALALERRLFRWYGRKDTGTGILRNRTDGGEGNIGGKHSEATKAKIGLAHKGRTFSDERRKQMSESRIGGKPPVGAWKKGHIPWVTGKVMDQKYRDQCSKVQKKRFTDTEQRKQLLNNFLTT